MDWHSPQVVLGFGATWTALLLGAVKFLFTREFNRFEKRLDAIADHEKKIAELYGCINNRPNCQQHAQQLVTFSSLDLRMDRVEGLVNRVDGRLEGIGRAVDLMNEFLINRGDK